MSQTTSSSSTTSTTQDGSFYAVAVSSVDNAERRHFNGVGGITAGGRRFSSTFNLNSTSSDNDSITNVARSFLAKACPTLLAVLDTHADSNSSKDRLVKIGRSVNATLRYGEYASSSSTATNLQHQQQQMNIWSREEAARIGLLDKELRAQVADANLRRLVKECTDLANLLTPTDIGNKKVPTVRYGRTELRMPILSLGCMRFQQSWQSDRVTTPAQLDAECQENLLGILRYAISVCGMTHIETAKAYGCSEYQLGLALRILFDEGICRRADLIVQTKSGITGTMTKAEYKTQILEQISRLGVDYVDLFSVHGVNTNDHYDWLFAHPNGQEHNLIDVVHELQSEGKIRYIGFSTHGPAHVTAHLIESNAFDYINLHYHFMGSYTASGDGNVMNMEGNLSNILLANKYDMGVFVISAFDKGGRVYTPSHLCRELTLPEMEPMEYGAQWLWYHDSHHCRNSAGAIGGGGITDDNANQLAKIHTIVCGAARPSDLDQPVLAALRSMTPTGRHDFDTVTERIRARKDRILGMDWATTWHIGLPNYSQSTERGFQIGNIVWLYNIIHMYGMLDFAKDRYANMVNNSSKWDQSKSWKENVSSFHWMPGCAYDPTYYYTYELKDVPERNRPRVMEAMKFVHEYCIPKQVKLEIGGEPPPPIPLEWQAAYDMRPWTSFPER
jgi:hypothetical protein